MIVSDSGETYSRSIATRCGMFQECQESRGAKWAKSSERAHRSTCISTRAYFGSLKMHWPLKSLPPFFLLLETLLER